jgi:NTE family protein
VSWGLHTGDAFVSWLDQLIHTKLGKANITFEELFQKTGNELVVTASCVNRRMQRYFCRQHHPDMPVVHAVRMSMAIPLFFTPVRFEGALYCDGGLLNNFPLWVFGTLMMMNHCVYGCADSVSCSVRPAGGAGMGSPLCVARQQPHTRIQTPQ